MQENRGGKKEHRGCALSYHTIKQANRLERLTQCSIAKDSVAR